MKVKEKEVIKEQYKLSDEARKKIISQIPFYLERYGMRKIKEKK